MRLDSAIGRLIKSHSNEGGASNEGVARSLFSIAKPAKPARPGALSRANDVGGVGGTDVKNQRRSFPLLRNMEGKRLSKDIHTCPYNTVLASQPRAYFVSHRSGAVFDNSSPLLAYNTERPTDRPHLIYFNENFGEGFFFSHLNKKKPGHLLVCSSATAIGSLSAKVPNCNQPSTPPCSTAWEPETSWGHEFDNATPTG